MRVTLTGPAHSKMSGRARTKSTIELAWRNRRYFDDSKFGAKPSQSLTIFASLDQPEAPNPTSRAPFCGKSVGRARRIGRMSAISTALSVALSPPRPILSRSTSFAE